MDFAREVADRILFMDEGRIVEKGPPDRLLGSPCEERPRRFLQRILQSWRGELGVLRERVRLLETELAVVRDELEAERRRTRELQQRLRELTGRAARLQEELETARRRLAARTRRLHELEGELAALRERVGPVSGGEREP